MLSSFSSLLASSITVAISTLSQSSLLISSSSIPHQEDVLRVRSPTSGIIEYCFDMQGEISYYLYLDM